MYHRALQTVDIPKRYAITPEIFSMTEYEANAASLATHSVPDWFHDAKLGIFIHWGPYSVPAWADPEHEQSYAEWYPYEMHREGSPTRTYHLEEYGADVTYLDFAREWEAANWDPDAWADFFADIGARYVVLTGEHCDGFPLWPSHYTKYNAGEMGPQRDLVGELSTAVRNRDLKFAASYHANLNYYQPGFDGLFGHPAYDGTEAFEDTDPQPEYVDFMNAKHRELIRRYEPDLLWFDVPQADADHLNAYDLIADYYNEAKRWGKEVAVNDRASTDHSNLAQIPGDAEDIELKGDFGTPEYARFDDIQPFKWETCRGIGDSFGYNRVEDQGQYLSAADLVHLLADVVSKNGNLLINVGPKADGTIPDSQRTPLARLGDWLDRNGEAIFDTRPWTIAEPEGIVDAPGIRYTWGDDSVYTILFEWPSEPLALPLGDHVDPGAVTHVERLHEGRVDWEPADNKILLSLPDDPVVTEPAYVIKIGGLQHPQRASPG